MQWRQMTESDVPAVIRLAAVIHVDHPEDDAVLSERFTLMPRACFVLDGPAGPVGYTLAHPARFEEPPALNALMRGIPMGADCLHLHDIALLGIARGTGASARAVEHVVCTARENGFVRLSIVAVNGTEPFWQKHGFVPHTSPALEKKLASYDGPASYMIRPV
ncbi:MAG: GNAT family N-acetyltransferase [Alphaproteobacteria bacterium]|nr:MAG: GNAT family N-acetyltransferase [Alphaproteobacteria bacterium]